MQKVITMVLCCAALLLSAITGRAETLTVASVDAEPGATVTLDVTIDVPDRVSAAVFTLTPTAINSPSPALTHLFSTTLQTSGRNSRRSPTPCRRTR